MRRFHGVIELDGPEMQKSRQMDVHLTAWTRGGARRKAIGLAQAYAQEYKERGQTLSQYQLVHFEEMKWSWLGPVLFLIFILVVGAALALPAPV